MSNFEEVDILSIQRIIGYDFVDTRYLVAAFTHASFVNEHNVIGNERIEFLGDCVLNFLVGEREFFKDRTASEGVLSRRRSEVVSREPLARLVDELGLTRFLRVGEGVDKSAFQPKARSNLFEAMLGAVYLDGGIEACKIVLDKLFYNAVVPEIDCISAINQYIQQHRLNSSANEYRDGDVFIYELTIVTRKFIGRGTSRHAAKKAAFFAASEYWKSK